MFGKRLLKYKVFLRLLMQKGPTGSIENFYFFYILSLLFVKFVVMGIHQAAEF